MTGLRGLQFNYSNWCMSLSNDIGMECSLGHVVSTTVFFVDSSTLGILTHLDNEEC